MYVFDENKVKIYDKQLREHDISTKKWHVYPMFDMTGMHQYQISIERSKLCQPS